MQPKHSRETEMPVLPRVLYCIESQKGQSFSLRTRLLAGLRRAEARRAARKGCPTSLTGQRVRPDLEFHDLALRAFSTFDMPDEMRAVVCPQRPAFPPGIGIVDAAIHAARVKAERIGNPQRNPVLRL